MGKGKGSAEDEWAVGRRIVWVWKRGKTVEMGRMEGEIFLGDWGGGNPKIDRSFSKFGAWKSCFNF